MTKNDIRQTINKQHEKFQLNTKSNLTIPGIGQPGADETPMTYRFHQPPCTVHDEKQRFGI